MSLLEVLISIFVLSIGLLGVAAILPVGRFEIVQGSIADRSAACGQAGLHEVAVRRMLEPRLWGTVDATTGRLRPIVPPVGRGALQFGQSYAIDPLYIAENGDPATGRFNPAVATFPYNAPGPCMQRVILDWVRLTGDPTVDIPRQRAVFGRIFTWHDELVIPVPDDDTERPRQVMFCQVVQGGGLTGASARAAWPPRLFDRVTDDNNNTVVDSEGNGLEDNLPPLVREVAGNYTWLVTVTPVVESYDFVAPTPQHPSPPYVAGRPYYYFDQRPLYQVSIVVFYKRDMLPPGAATGDDPPGERVVTANFLGAGWGGGDLRLVASQPNYLELKEGQWLMLCGRDRGRGVDVFRWYRIVAAADIDPAAPTERLVTVQGPDWDLNWCGDADGNGVPDAQAALFTGVVGVYTTTVELDGW